MTEKEQLDILEEWLKLHTGLIFKVVRAYTIADHDDLFQEIIIQVWHSIPAFRQESSVTTWLYRIAFTYDEKALHNRIQSKMSTLLRFTSISEWMLILINLGTGGILLGFNPFKPGANIFLYLESAWVLALALYLVAHHIRRVKASRRFDRSIHGDLDHSISIASYQMRLSQIIRWNFLPMGAIMILSGWETGKLLRVGALILVSYTLAFYVTSNGYRANKRRRRELQVLKEKLETGK